VKKSAKPFKCSIRSQGEEIENKLEGQIAEMLSKGIIEKVDSSKVHWAFPFFWTRAKGKRSCRSAVDFRPLNPHLEYEEIAFPTAEEIIDDYQPSECWYSKLDLYKAYHQLLVRDPDNCSVHGQVERLTSSNSALTGRKNMTKPLQT
jgi:hypothetical protein